MSNRITKGVSHVKDNITDAAILVTGASLVIASEALKKITDITPCEGYDHING